MLKTIIVIGGSSGIGFACCEKLKSEYRIINMSRSQNPNVENIFCDTTNYETIKKAFNQLDCVPYGLIYCAGYVNPAQILEVEDEDIDKTIRTCLSGTMVATREFVRLNKKEGKIIYIASTAGMRPQPGWSIYSSSKAGLISFASTMSIELESYGIQVYCLSPGRTASKLRSALAPTEDPTKIMQASEVSNFVYELIKDRGFLDSQNIVIRKKVTT